MLRRFCLLIATMSILAPNVAAAFNGNRQGFVIAGGVGYCPRSTVNSDAQGVPTQVHSGTGWNGFIGYGWSQSNLLVYEANLAYYRRHDDTSNVSVLQGFVGPTWYHYFGRPGRALFTAVGLGFYRYLVYERDTDVGTIYNGAGAMIGLGAEFARHFQVGVYNSAGFTHPNDVAAEHSNWGPLLTCVFF